MHSKYAEFSVKCINYNAELLKKKNIANKKAKGRLHHRKMTEAHVLHPTFFFLEFVQRARVCLSVNVWGSSVFFQLFLFFSSTPTIYEFCFYISLHSSFFVAFHPSRILLLILVSRRTTVTMSVPFSYFALALTTFLLLSIHFFLLYTNQSASECMCLCVRAVSLFSILFSWLYCLRFVLFRFFSLSFRF